MKKYFSILTILILLEGSQDANAQTRFSKGMYKSLAGTGLYSKIIYFSGGKEIQEMIHYRLEEPMPDSLITTFDPSLTGRKMELKYIRYKSIHIKKPGSAELQFTDLNWNTQPIR